MGYRSAFGFGILAAGFFCATVVSAPAAMAELPPGLICDTDSCTNNTDVQYVVQGTVLCHGIGTRESDVFVVRPHSAGSPSYPCPSRTIEGPDGTPVVTLGDGTYSDLRVDKVAVDADRRWLDTGSAEPFLTGSGGPA